MWIFFRFCIFLLSSLVQRKKIQILCTWGICNSKTMVLDVKAILNNNSIVNLEMQVINCGDWPERSLSYLCRCFDNIESGRGYDSVKGAFHIGFLNYTLL